MTISRYTLLVAVAACSLIVSCASAPKPEQAAPPPPAKPAAAAPTAPAPAKAEVQAPDALRDEAAALRKEAFDLGLKELLPPDYAEAEGAFQDGTAKYGRDNEAARAAFEKAVASFRALIDKGLPLLSGIEGKKAADLREAAVRGGAEGAFAQLFAASDGGLAEAKGKEGSGDYRGAIASYRLASSRFGVLAALCDARSTRELISSRDYAKWDGSNWSLAETAYASSQSLLQGDPKAAATQVDEARLRYNLTLQNARGYYLGDRKGASDTERERARGIKTEVAARSDFQAASDLRSRAEAGEAAGDIEGAAALYDKSASSFTAAYAVAKGKMDIAKSELDSLDEALRLAGAGR
jgi:hypothetical protein